MFKLALPTSSRAFSTVRILRKDNPVAEAAKAFKADGKIGSKFTSKGDVGETFEKDVGGAFSKDSAIGKQFEKDGAIGGAGQKVAEKVEEATSDERPAKASTRLP